MMNRVDIALDWPVFVWVAIIGIAVCIVLGLCHSAGSDDGRPDVYGEIASSLIVSAGFGIMTVITCLIYSMTIPNFWLWRVGLFLLSAIAIVLLTTLFWGIAYTASLLSMNNGEEEGGRKHHRRTR